MQFHPLTFFFTILTFFTFAHAMPAQRSLLGRTVSYNGVAARDTPVLDLIGGNTIANPASNQIPPVAESREIRLVAREPEQLDDSVIQKLQEEIVAALAAEAPVKRSAPSTRFQARLLRARAAVGAGTD